MHARSLTNRFARLVMPAANVDRSETGGLELVGVRTLGEALDELIT